MKTMQKTHGASPSSEKAAMIARTLPWLSSERVRLFEAMIVSLIVLAVIGVMLSALTATVLRAQDAARCSTARVLYMAVQDYTAHQLNAGAEVQELQGINETSAFLQNYVSGQIKGKLKVQLSEVGSVERIEYTEEGKTVIMP